MNAVASDWRFVDKPRHQSVGDDRRVGENRRWVVVQVALAAASIQPALPDVDAAVDFRVAILRVDAVDVAMSKLP